MKTLVCIPAYNEAQVIAQTLRDVKKQLKKHSNTDLIVVDDGSSDQTSQIVTKAKVKLLRHIVNRGLGGAIGTGLAYARQNHYDCFVTIDADGQHDPRDIAAVTQPVRTHKADVVIGTRTQSKHGQIPTDRKIIIALSNLLTLFLFGIFTSDSLSGFRAFNKKAIHSIRLITDRMEVSNEFFSEIKRANLKLIEVPIKIIYTPYSRAKGQSNANSIHVIFKLFLRLFR